MLSQLAQLKWNLYLTDFIDVLIIAILIYSILAVLRRTKTLMVIFGMGFAGALYILADTFNLYLTSSALRYFVSISVVIFVIIFQSEIRKYFEFIGLIGTRQIKTKNKGEIPDSYEEIIHSCVHMAQNKIGALIVIKGEDDLESFIDGGTLLDGIISEELLLSLFDPHSDGHDGGLIIEGDRIKLFGTHLPLSTNFKVLGKRGTRHSAALGLAENTDALCIVVSEEKGHISICNNSKIKTLKKFEDLEKEISKFFNKYVKKSKKEQSISFLKNNTFMKLGALGLASVIWFFTAYQAGIVQKEYKVPITIENAAKMQNIEIEDYSPKEAVVTVSGRGEKVFENIKTEDFNIKISVNELQNGINKKQLTKKNIQIPGNLIFESYKPEEVLLTATKYYSVTVPVKINSSGEPKEGVVIGSIEATPNNIEVLVPEDQDAPIEIATEVIDLTEIDESIIVPVKLIVPPKNKLPSGINSTNVAINIKTEN